MNKKLQKQKAIELLTKLKVYKGFISDFQKDTKFVCLYESFGGGYWVYQYPELMEKISWLEKEYDCLVYGITHTYTNIGEFYDFLLVTSEAEEWDDLVTEYSDNQYCVFSYVWNKSDSELSEFGSIVVKPQFGGLRRIG